ncbi:MAG: GDYXXLXY domain-containing protein [Candidatus Omnitrophica bacterium]|nr:GDYXXLXY domain-containing protein [Candidatus Omnitrophota bacterium]MBU1923111.1 GDYXXLXY domain-containing protein [Candidatus Omnitrophota bacterium]
MNKKLIFIAVSFLWIVVAVGLIISKQHIIRTGKTVLLETVPVDPRDFLRGDYIILRYKISTIDLQQIQSEESYYGQGERVYVKLEPKEKFWEARAVETKKPVSDNGVYIKARVKYCYNKKLELNYGIESYFVPEGEGKDIEKNMRGNKSSVEVEVLVDTSGNAIIKKVFAQ